MLLPVGEDLPEAREELNPGLLSQRGGDVAELHQSVQQSPRLKEIHQIKMYYSPKSQEMPQRAVEKQRQHTHVIA